MAKDWRACGWRGIAVVLASACTAINPAYEGDGGGGQGEGEAPCVDDDECADDVFCNGEEQCAPESPEADARGCMAGPEPCEAGCIEEGPVCRAECSVTSDLDGDGIDAVECGGLDCDDERPGFALGDWAHCGACNRPCDVEQACEDGECVAARRVFVTSAAYTGSLGGLEGADERCQAHADEVGLEGVFRAYMVGGFEGLERLEHPAVPFVRLDGVRVADDWLDLSDGSIAAPLDLDELRQPAQGNVWTGLVDVIGNPEDNQCRDWTFDAAGCLELGVPCGGAGEVLTLDSHWDGYFVFNCSDEYRLYCIEQALR